MYCPKCGTPNPDQASFCTGCGIPLKPGQNTPGRSGGSKPLLITIISLLTVILICLILFLTLGKDNNPPVTAPDTVESELQSAQNTDFPADVHNPDARFQSFDWLSSDKITLSDLAGLSSGDLRILRNAIFAMNGYKFKSADLQEYFSRFPWYSPRYADVTSQLSAIEQANIALIQQHEGKGTTSSTSKGKTKLRNVGYTDDYSDVVCYIYLDASDLRGLSSAQLRILRNTIYARHGRRFKDAALQHYFNSMYWYTPTCNEVSPSSLSAVEKHNIALIQSLE